jgi:poly [ADP-ribose] polymerase 10/14/15
LPSAEELAALKKNVGDAGALAPPAHWDDIKDKTIVQKHEIKKGDQEYDAVVQAFMSSLQRPHFNKDVKVIKVERIQNLAMWQSYVVKLQTVCYRETGGKDDDEAMRKALERFEKKWLFHGSNFEVVDKILQQGFNRSFCGKNATAYGKGVYFARCSSYSADPTYAVPDCHGNQYMMLCRVVVGEYCRGKVRKF